MCGGPRRGHRPTSLGLDGRVRGRSVSDRLHWRFTAYLSKAGHKVSPVKPDSSVSACSYTEPSDKPLTWMSPPCWLIEDGNLWIVSSKRGRETDGDQNLPDAPE